MFCPKCGAENKDMARFCKNCGQPVPRTARPARAPKKMPWLIGILALAMLCVIAGVVIYARLKPEKTIPTPRLIETPTVAPATLIPAATPEEVAPPKPPYELVRTGDFSIALAGVGREEDTAVLYFAITKVSDNSGPQMLQVTLIDDHENRYIGKLEIDLEGASDVIINALPKGFAYVDVVEIGMPKVASIERIKLGERETAFKKVKFAKPQFLREFGDLAITKGQSVQVGRWLSFTMEPIVPAPRHWELPIRVENEEYSPLPARVEMAVQHSDGTVSWGQSKSVSAPALSEASAMLTLPIPSWVEGGPPQPQALLLAYTDESPEGKMTLRMYSISPSDLPPLVGQGPRQMEDVFLAAYKRRGGQQVMGDPLNTPQWFSGGNKPKDEHDVLIQEFAAVSWFGRSAIVWDEQGNASEAYVIHGTIWEKYTSLGGPYFRSKAQGLLLGAPTSDTVGSYNTFEGGAIASHHEQTIPVMGKICEKWQEKGLFAGPLGFPTGDESPAPVSGAQGFNTTGWVQAFQGGHIVYICTGKRTGKAFETHGAVDELYMKALQGSAGWLGFPVRDQYQIESRLYFHDRIGYAGADFEGGFIASEDGAKWQAFPYETEFYFLNRLPKAVVGQEVHVGVGITNRDGVTLDYRLEVWSGEELVHKTWATRLEHQSTTKLAF